MLNLMNAIRFGSTRWSRRGFFLALLLLVGPTARADLLYAVSDGVQNLYTLDPATGQITSSVPVPGSNGGMEDIVPDGTGQLLLASEGLVTNPIGSDYLFRLNPATGQESVIGLITNGTDRAYWVEGLAWVNGTLYGSAAAIALTNPPTYLGYGPDASNLLIKIDPATGRATEVGAFGPRFLNVEDIAYSPKYGLIGADIGTLNPDPNQPNGAYSTFHTTPALIQIDPSTGLATKINDLPYGPLVPIPNSPYMSPSGPYVAGLDFTPDGATLYGTTIQTQFGGTTSGLVIIDPVTAALTDVGTVNLPILDGITFAGSPVPEPSAMVLLGFGLAVLAAGGGWHALRRVGPRRDAGA